MYDLLDIRDWLGQRPGGQDSLLQDDSGYLQQQVGAYFDEQVAPYIQNKKALKDERKKFLALLPKGQALSGWDPQSIAQLNSLSALKKNSYLLDARDNRGNYAAHVELEYQDLLDNPGQFSEADTAFRKIRYEALRKNSDFAVPNVLGEDGASGTADTIIDPETGQVIQNPATARSGTSDKFFDGIAYGARQLAAGFVDASVIGGGARLANRLDNPGGGYSDSTLGNIAEKLDSIGDPNAGFGGGVIRGVGNVFGMIFGGGVAGLGFKAASRLMTRGAMKGAKTQAAGRGVSLGWGLASGQIQSQMEQLDTYAADVENGVTNYSDEQRQRLMAWGVAGGLLEVLLPTAVQRGIIGNFTERLADSGSASLLNGKLGGIFSATGAAALEGGTEVAQELLASLSRDTLSGGYDENALQEGNYRESYEQGGAVGLIVQTLFGALKVKQAKPDDSTEPEPVGPESDPYLDTVIADVQNSSASTEPGQASTATATANPETVGQRTPQSRARGQALQEPSIQEGADLMRSVINPVQYASQNVDRDTAVNWMSGLQSPGGVQAALDGADIPSDVELMAGQIEANNPGPVSDLAQEISRAIQQDGLPGAYKVIDIRTDLANPNQSLETLETKLLAAESVINGNIRELSRASAKGEIEGLLASANADVETGRVLNEDLSSVQSDLNDQSFLFEKLNESGANLSGATVKAISDKVRAASNTTERLRVLREAANDPGTVSKLEKKKISKAANFALDYFTNAIDSSVSPQQALKREYSVGLQSIRTEASLQSPEGSVGSVSEALVRGKNVRDEFDKLAKTNQGVAKLLDNMPGFRPTDRHVKAIARAYNKSGAGGARQFLDTFLGEVAEGGVQLRPHETEALTALRQDFALVEAAGDNYAALLTENELATISPNEQPAPASNPLAGMPLFGTALGDSLNYNTPNYQVRPNRFGVLIPPIPGTAEGARQLQGYSSTQGVRRPNTEPRLAPDSVRRRRDLSARRSLPDGAVASELEAISRPVVQSQDGPPTAPSAGDLLPEPGESISDYGEPLGYSPTIIAERRAARQEARDRVQSSRLRRPRNVPQNPTATQGPRSLRRPRPLGRQGDISPQDRQTLGQIGASLADIQADEIQKTQAAVQRQREKIDFKIAWAGDDNAGLGSQVGPAPANQALRADDGSLNSIDITQTVKDSIQAGTLGEADLAQIRSGIEEGNYRIETDSVEALREDLRKYFRGQSLGPLNEAIAEIGVTSLERQDNTQSTGMPELDVYRNGDPVAQDPDWRATVAQRLTVDNKRHNDLLTENVMLRGALESNRTEGLKLEDTASLVRTPFLVIQENGDYTLGLTGSSSLQGDRKFLNDIRVALAQGATPDPDAFPQAHAQWKYEQQANNYERTLRPGHAVSDNVINLMLKEMDDIPGVRVGDNTTFKAKTDDDFRQETDQFMRNCGAHDD